ncbi:MAG TPA: DUF4276 family protein [Polyangiaceae bacterium LLY-WYZ-14_1]|nr:DUF4276 family protein [Polyangiaceae bacterium LLY-WYZ-14_1]
MTLVFLLEEPSARELLRPLLPKLIPSSVRTQFIVFEGKQDLERKLVRRIRGYLTPETHFVVVRDQDAGDCLEVKRRLVELVTAAGRPDTLVRIACRELESWVLGDLFAVGEAYGVPKLADLQQRRSYRDPDRIVRPVEELKRHVRGYQKLDGARRVAPFLRPQHNTSRSFRAFCQGVRTLVDPADGE